MSFVFIRLWAMAICAMATLAVLGPCRAAPVTMPIVPANAHIGLTVFAMGFWPLPGQFLRFAGWLTMDPAVPATCHVSLAVEVASLHMEDDQRTPMALGPNLLDEARYPALRYGGSCALGLATGMLTLHGVARQLTLTTLRQGDMINASGSLRRGDYGVSGLPELIGRRVEIRFSVTLPPGFASRLPPN